MLKRVYQITRNFSTKNSVNSVKERLKISGGRIFGKYLIVTNIVSTGVLMLTGDLIEQELNHDLMHYESPRYDSKRLARMFTVGLTMGPVVHFYYGSIGRVWPRRDVMTVGKKILMDQFIAAPVFITLFFYTLGLLEMKPLKHMNEEFYNKFITVYTMDWCVWPPTQFINFYYVPRRFQVTYINVVTMLYDVFLSYIKHDSDD